MDINAILKDLGLEETAVYKYRIRRMEDCGGYYIERLNKNNGFMCSMAVSATLLKSLRSGLIEDFASLLKRDFDSIEQKAILKKQKNDETLFDKRTFGMCDIGDKISPII